ncbi:hypothetical protein [Castellaniella sp. UC4442_H9]
MTDLSYEERKCLRRAAEDARDACNPHYGPFVEAVAHPLRILALLDMADRAAEPTAQDRKDAERWRWATALDDNSETLHSIVLSFGGDQAKINERVDVYRACAARATKERA